MFSTELLKQTARQLDISEQENRKLKRKITALDDYEEQLGKLVDKMKESDEKLKALNELRDLFDEKQTNTEEFNQLKDIFFPEIETTKLNSKNFRAKRQELEKEKTDMHQQHEQLKKVYEENKSARLEASSTDSTLRTSSSTFFSNM